MTKRLLWLSFFGLMLITPAQALRLPPQGPKAYGYVMWHEEYFLFAARVEDSLLVGTSKEPQVFPRNDDGIELSLDIPLAGGKRAISRLAISAAGGFAVLSREESGRWKTDNSWLQPPATLKFAVALDGTLNNPSDRDRAFSVEVAIPWQRLGGAPRPMAIVGFNFLVRVRGENQTFVSWSPGILSEEDNADPSRWGKMLLFPGSRPSTAEQGAFACPKTFRLPFVDGKLGAEEWIGASVLTLSKPEPEFQPLPGDTRRGEEMPLLMALYHYDYLGSSPPAFLNYQPREGPGPWFSADRPRWHREQLREMQRAGIEVLLAAYSPDTEARGDWARRGLAALCEALKELRATRNSYPLVGMYLDVGGLSRALGEPADLTTLRGQRILYGAIREFYQHIPAEFRAEIGEPGKAKGHPILLGPPTGLVNWDGEFIKYANQAFARDFAGASLVWFADAGWKSRGLGDLHAYPPFSGDQTTAYDAAGQAAIAVLSPGYADPGTSAIRVRSQGQELREEWRRMFALAPTYLVLVSWNDFPNGTHIAPSRQEGFDLVDSLSLLVSQEAEKISRPVRLKKASLPPLIASGGKTTAELVLTNTSAQEIGTDERVRFDLRILEEASRFTLAEKTDVVNFRIPPGGSVRILLPVTARDANDKPLSPGRYMVEFSLLRSQLAYLRSRWLARTLASFRLPLQVERPPEYAFSILGSTLRSHLKSGGRYTASLTLRNDGSRSWKKKDARLSYQWYRVKDDLEAATSEQAEVLETKGLSTSLPGDVGPGEIITVTVVLETTAQGRPLPPWNRGEMWHYALAWLLEVEGKRIEAKRGTCPEVVYVVREDLGSHFVDSTTPREMSAGKEYPVEVVLTNAGADTWAAGETELAYHWFFWDGNLAQGAANSTHLPVEVPPGESVKLSAVVKAPSYGGPYFLLWDLKQGENLASSSLNARGNETLRVPVMVQGGPCHSVDLADYFNVIAATSDRRRSSGDLDGLGNSFPLEALPPDLSGNSLEVYPSGYYLPRHDSNPPALRHITFRYPPKSAGVARALACRAQNIPLPGLKASRLHLLGAGTGAGISGSITITFADGHIETLPLAMSSWLEPPSHGEAVGFMASHLHTSRGDNPRQQPYLHHYTLALSQPGEVVSLLLPDNPEMKVFAIALESPISE